MRVEVGGNAVAYRDEALHVVFAQPVDLAHAEARARTASLPSPCEGSGLGEGGQTPTCVI